MGTGPDRAFRYIRSSAKTHERKYPIIEGCRSVEVSNSYIDVMDGAAWFHVALTMRRLPAELCIASKPLNTTFVYFKLGVRRLFVSMADN